MKRDKFNVRDMKNNISTPCPFCARGNMITQIINYEMVDSLNNKVKIPNIEVDICDVCGEKFFGYDAAVTLDEIKKKGKRITLFLKPELQKRISSLAKKHERSFDAEVNCLLETTLP